MSLHDDLPPLPEGLVLGTSRYGTIFRGHTDEAMRAYGLACMAAQAGPDAPCVLEWGAVSMPVGHPSRVTEFSVHATVYDAIAAGALCGFDWRVYGVGLDGPNVEDSPVEKLKQALWVAVEHNALHFGENHNTVVQGRAALKAFEEQP